MSLFVKLVVAALTAVLAVPAAALPAVAGERGHHYRHDHDRDHDRRDRDRDRNDRGRVGSWDHDDDEDDRRERWRRYWREHRTEHRHGHGRHRHGHRYPKRRVYDWDRDQMPTWWELRYELNPVDPGDADRDTDGDGVSNLDEFRAGTDPRHADAAPAPEPTPIPDPAPEPTPVPEPVPTVPVEDPAEEPVAGPTRVIDLVAVIGAYDTATKKALIVPIVGDEFEAAVTSTTKVLWSTGRAGSVTDLRVGAEVTRVSIADVGGSLVLREVVLAAS